MANMNIGKLSIIGNTARSIKLSPEQRKSIASNAAKTRWAKHAHEVYEKTSGLCSICGIKRRKHSGHLDSLGNYTKQVHDFTPIS